MRSFKGYIASIHGGLRMYCMSLQNSVLQHDAMRRNRRVFYICLPWILEVDDLSHHYRIESCDGVFIYNCTSLPIPLEPMSTICRVVMYSWLTGNYNCGNCGVGCICHHYAGGAVSTRSCYYRRAHNSSKQSSMLEQLHVWLIQF